MINKGTSRILSTITALTLVTSTAAIGGTAVFAAENVPLSTYYSTNKTGTGVEKTI